MLQSFPVAQGVAYRVVFGRRKDHVAAGLTYTVQFSADLQTWTTSGTSPEVLTGPGNTADVETVAVPFPASVPAPGGAKEPAFGRVRVAMP